MNSAGRFVVDTNVLISALLLPNSIPGLALQSVERNGRLLVSLATLDEFDEVMNRPKLGRLLLEQTRRNFFQAYQGAADVVVIHEPIRGCRDPHDDKFLETAVHGRADALLTGDQDLLQLDPFQGVRGLSPRQFLDLTR